MTSSPGPALSMSSQFAGRDSRRIERRADGAHGRWLCHLLFCARFAVDGTVTIANAGHPSPYCNGHEVKVEGGLPLGIMADVVHDESIVSGSRFTLSPMALWRPRTRSANYLGLIARVRWVVNPRKRLPTPPRPGGRTMTSPW